MVIISLPTDIQKLIINCLEMPDIIAMGSIIKNKNHFQTHKYKVMVIKVPEIETKEFIKFKNSNTTILNWGNVVTLDHIDNLITISFKYGFNEIIHQGQLPNTLTELSFNNYKYCIDPNVLPKTLTKLNLGNSYNCRIYHGTLPGELTYLNLGNAFNKQIDENILPKKLLYLNLGWTYTYGLDNILPKSITHLKLSIYYCNYWPDLPNLIKLEFTNKLDGYIAQPKIKKCMNTNLYNIKYLKFDVGIFNSNNKLPETLTYLNLGDEFNDIINLPENLIELHFGYKFNQPILNRSINTNGIIIPNNLRHLSFCTFFNQILPENCLPLSLEYLKFGYYYNQPIYHNVLPKFLKELHFGNDFNQPLLSGVLPESLTCLQFNEMFDQNIDDILLPNIKYMSFGGKFTHKIPNHILINLVKLVYAFNKPLQLKSAHKLENLIIGKFNHDIKENDLPHNLKKITFEYEYECDFNGNLVPGCFPLGLEQLSFDYWEGKYNKNILPGVLPDSLTYLNLSRDFNLKIGQNVLPKSLKKLIFSYKFNQPIDKGVLPESLENLEFGNDFNHSLDDVLPGHLEYLYVGISFDHPITLPSSLLSFSCGNKLYNKKIILSPKIMRLIGINMSLCEYID